MPDGSNLTNITAILHLPKKLTYPISKFYEIVQSILQQYDQSLDLIILDQLLDDNIENEISRMNTEGFQARRLHRGTEHLRLGGAVRQRVPRAAPE